MIKFMLTVQNKNTNEIFKIKNKKDLNDFIGKNKKNLKDFRAKSTIDQSESENASEMFCKALGYDYEATKPQMPLTLTKREAQ